MRTAGAATTRGPSFVRRGASGPIRRLLPTRRPLPSIGPSVADQSAAMLWTGRAGEAVGELVLGLLLVLRRRGKEPDATLHDHFTSSYLVPVSCDARRHGLEINSGCNLREAPQRRSAVLRERAPRTAAPTSSRSDVRALCRRRVPCPRNDTRRSGGPVPCRLLGNWSRPRAGAPARFRVGWT